jgi:hypothetical protein
LEAIIFQSQFHENIYAIYYLKLFEIIYCKKILFGSFIRIKGDHMFPSGIQQFIQITGTHHENGIIFRSFDRIYVIAIDANLLNLPSSKKQMIQNYEKNSIYNYH